MSANATHRTRAPGPSYETIHAGSIETRLGAVHVAVSDDGVIAASLPGETRARFEARLHTLAPRATVSRATNSRSESPALAAALLQLREFFVGKRARFDLPIDLRVAPFTRRVLLELARVPAGETRTYGSLAKAVGSPNAARAVGRALSANPIPIILPCHRVVGATSLGGFAGKERRLDTKEALLKLEGTGSRDGS